MHTRNTNVPMDDEVPAIYAVPGASQRDLRRRRSAPTKVANGNTNGSCLLSIVDKLSAVNREILLNIWMTVPDSRNSDKPEGPLHASASVHFSWMHHLYVPIYKYEQI
jgi:hypothetical protein